MITYDFINNNFRVCCRISKIIYWINRMCSHCKKRLTSSKRFEIFSHKLFFVSFNYWCFIMTVTFRQAMTGDVFNNGCYVIFLYKFIHILPSFATFSGFCENDRLPITLWESFLITSRTGTVFMFIPTFLNISHTLSM